MWERAKGGTIPGWDLHTHTTASDGTVSPGELVRLAQKNGLAGIAITDHETTAALEEARAEGRRRGIEAIPGIEINTDEGEGEFHFLGYLIDPGGPSLQAALERSREQRLVRARAILARLREAGIGAEEERVLAAANGAPICRPHIAAALVEAGHASTLGEAFHRYLGRRTPFYVPRTGLTVREAIATIRGAGGVPILSHPRSLAASTVLALVPLGLLGVEVNHPDHSPEVAARWRDLARREGLAATGGSDYHGAKSIHPEQQLGSILAPPEALDSLRRAQERALTGA